MKSLNFVSLLFLTFTLFSPSHQVVVHARLSSSLSSLKPLSPFSIALDALQANINYTFKDVGLLRRAVTHASFSEENNKALSELGFSVIKTEVYLRLLSKDVDISAKALNQRTTMVTKEETCASEGSRLGLQKIVRVSPKTNSTAPIVVCGAFRAIFGAVAVDTWSSDKAGKVFWGVHGGAAGFAMAM